MAMRTLRPAFPLHHIGGHTKGLQVVRVWTRLGWLVLASDGSHYYANMIEGAALPGRRERYGNGGWLAQRARAREQRALRGAGHDPLVMKRYRAPTPALEGIAVRLDAEPTQ